VRAQRELVPIGLVTVEPHLERVDRARLSRGFGLRYFTCDFSEQWFRDEVDAVIIGTPPDTHYDLVLRCLGLGKHVLVEKPFALSEAQAAEMSYAARTADRKLGVVHNFQFARACRRAKALVESGALGELRSVHGFQSSNHRRRLPGWYRKLPMGLFTDESPHLIYLLSSYLKGTERLWSIVGPKLAADDNTPRNVAVHFEPCSGPSGSLQMCFTGALSEWYLAIFGSKATALLDLFRDILIVLPDDDRHLAGDVFRTSWRAVRSHLGGFLASGWRHLAGVLDYGNGEVLRRFSAAILDDSPMPEMDAEAGRAVVAIMDRIGGGIEVRPTTPNQ
jgi:predicted dehydrogenase